jgi:tryptophan synthase alpha chain
MTTGLALIEGMFAQAKSEQRAAFLPYFMIGFPNYDASLEAIEGMARAGADGFEIGIPFSDPLADGPVNQEASQIALENGVTPRKCLAAIRELRERGVQQPMLMFTYLNPVLAYGVEAFVREAKAAGAQGFIIPDLPPDEAALLSQACAREEMALVFFIAPTSSAERIALATQTATGFIYILSLTGVTGPRVELPPDVQSLIAHVRTQTDKKLVLGFGISTPEQARSLNGVIDGFIVGSALVRQGKQGAAAVIELAGSLRRALDG